MKKLKTASFILMALAFTYTLAFQPACSKREAPETEQMADSAQEGEEKAQTAEEEKASKTSAESESEKASAAQVQKGEAAGSSKETAEKSDAEAGEDKKKVTNVKEAFQYTGKEMDKGLKKTGKTIKKAFVGD